MIEIGGDAHDTLRGPNGARDSLPRERTWQVLCLLTPFLLFAWCLPFVGSQTIGQDYGVYSIQAQLELQWALSKGQFPLYHPGVVAGAPAGTLTLGGLYHPLTHLAAQLPGFDSGRALDWMTLLRLLVLAGTHLVFWDALRRFGMDRGVAWVVALVTVYNLRMLDAVRYGAALEAYTGMILACGFILRSALEPERVVWTAASALSVFGTIVSGHPQMAIYGVLTTGFVGLCAPFVATAVGVRDGSMHRRYFLQLGAAQGIGLLLSAAYWLPFLLDYLSLGTGRTTKSRTWSLSSTSPYPGPLGLLRMLFWPFKADVHGSFAGSLIPVAIVAGTLLTMVRRRPPAVVVALLGLILVTIAYALGDNTPIHRWLWNILPFERNLRVPARTLMAVPVPMALLGVWLWSQRSRDGDAWSNPLAVGSAVACGLSLCIMPWLAVGKPETFSPETLRAVPRVARFFWCLMVLMGAAALFRVCWRETPSRMETRTLVGTFLLGLSIVMAYGTWTAPNRPMPGFDALARLRTTSIEYPGAFGSGMYTSDVLSHLEQTPLQPELARLFFDVDWVDNRAEAYRSMATGRPPTRAVAVPPGDQPPEGALSKTPDASRTGSVAVVFISGNRQDFAVESTAQAVFSAAVPYSDRWRVRVDDDTVSAFRVNGLHLGALVPAGRHTVSLRWVSPAARAGLALSLGGIAALLVWIMLRVDRGRWSATMAFTLTLIACGVAAAIAAGLEHGGESWGTRFVWDSRSAPQQADLAFGRPASGSPPADGNEDLHRIHPSRAVDGSPTTRFMSAPAGDRWWSVRFSPRSRVARVEIDWLERSGSRTELEITLEDASAGPLFSRRVATSGTSGRMIVPVEPAIEAAGIRVRRLGPEGPLVLAEVRAYPE